MAVLAMASRDEMEDLLRMALQAMDEAEADRIRGCERAALAGSGECAQQCLDVQLLCERVRLAAERTEWKRVDPELAVAFVKALGKMLAEEKDTEAQLALALTCLTMLASGVEDQRLHSVECIQSAIEICRVLLQRSILPAIDQSVLSRGSRARQMVKRKSSGKRKAKPAKQGGSCKKRKNDSVDGLDRDSEDRAGEESLGHDNEVSRNLFEDENNKENDMVCNASLSDSQLKALSARVCALILLLDRAVSQLSRLDDELLLSLTSLAVVSFDASPQPKQAERNKILKSIQEHSMGLYCSLFRIHCGQRSMMMEEIVDVMRKVPGLDKYIRNNSGRLSSFTFLSQGVLEMVQSVFSKKNTTKEEPYGMIPNIEAVISLSRDFIFKVFERCSSDSEYEDEEDMKANRAVLRHFVDDMLACLHEPEWPAAELFLKQIGVALANMLIQRNGKGKEKEKERESAAYRFSALALSILGDILSRVQSEILWAEKNVLVLPTRHATEKVFGECPLCSKPAGANAIKEDGIGTMDTPQQERHVEEEEETLVGSANDSISLTNSLTVSCVECKRDFHKACLLHFVKSETSFCCDDCRILVQLEQTNFGLKYDIPNPTLDTAKYDDIAAFRQLYLNYLVNNAIRGSNECKHSTEFCIALWHATDQREDSFSSDKVLQEQWNWCSGLLNRSFESKRKLREKLAISKIKVQAITRRLSFLRPDGLCNKAVCDMMLAGLLGTLSTGNALFRAEAIRALGIVMEANSMLMKEQKVKEAVEIRNMDEAITVREATLKLVGKYILSTPSLVSAYQDMLLCRLQDLGLSVRKRVVKILHDILVAHETGYDRESVLKGLVLRFSDAQEEDSVKDLILNIFRDIWFSAIPVTQPGDSMDWGACTPKIVKGRTLESMHSSGRCTPSSLRSETTDSAPSDRFLRTPMQLECTTGGQTPFSSFDIRKACSKPTSPILRVRHLSDVAEEICRLVSTDFNDEQDWLISALAQVMGLRKKDSESQIEGTLVLSCRKSCSALVHWLVCELQKEECGQHPTFEFLRMLGVICEVDPSLVAPHIDEFVGLLHRDALPDNSIHRTETFCVLLRIVSKCLPVSTVSRKLFEKIWSDLEDMFCRESPAVMLAAAECFGILGKKSQNAQNADEKIAFLLGKFLSFLRKVQNKSDHALSSKERTTVQRAILACGALTLAMSRVDESALESCIFFVNTNFKASFKGIRQTAVRSLCLIVERCPPVLLRDGIQRTLESLLEIEEEACVRAQVLMSLTELLEASERKAVSGEAQKDLENRTTQKDRVIGDQDGESEIITALMQHLSSRTIKLLFDKSAKVRIEAVSLIGTMLRQGLVNPLLCIEPMITLVADDKPLVHQTAHQFLCDLDERQPQFLIARVTQGIIHSHKYLSMSRRLRRLNQAQTVSSSTVSDSQEDDLEDLNLIRAVVDPESPSTGVLRPSFSLFSRLYRSCLSKTPSVRKQFFKLMLSVLQLAPRLVTNPDILNSSQSAGLAHSPESCEVLCYVAETLATLPFRFADEPLSLIVNVNKTISLYGELVKDAMRNILTSVDETAKTHENKTNIIGTVNIQLPFELPLKGTLSLILLHRLKVYLKSTYRLNDGRCQGFSESAERSGKSQSERAIPNPPEKLKPFPLLEQGMSALLRSDNVFTESSQKTRHHLKLLFRELCDVVDSDSMIGEEVSVSSVLK